MIRLPARTVWFGFAPLILIGLTGGQGPQVPAQPLAAQIRRVVEAMDFLGSPLPGTVKAQIEQAAQQQDESKAARDLQKALEPYCLFSVQINPESRVKVAAGTAKPLLVQDGWRQYLVKVHNDAGVTAELKAVSPNAQPLFNSPKESVRDRWLDMQMFNSQPLTKNLSGLGLEYRIISLYSRDAGKREAKVSFNVGQGTQDIGFRNEADVLFDITPSAEITFKVQDVDGKPIMARFEIRDQLGRVYPSQAKRLAPDFAFHPQVYRADGEKIKLPKGSYTFTFTRGPEYLIGKRQVTLDGKPQKLAFKLQRWIDPSKSGWWSGDHHIHAAGCAHYVNPSEGVHAPDMARHCQGEDLKVGCNLTWGPCFDYQHKFFTGKDDPVSKYPYLLRYDIEVSGFGSHQSGHLVLLRLKEGNYPGGDSDKHWPTLGLNTLRWAKKQGAVCGPAHSGSGLDVRAVPFAPQPDLGLLPNYIIPPFNGIGANEYIIDVTHEVAGPDGKMVPAVDFDSTVDTNPVSELNIWYHTLNCGYRTRISGETDFPCIYGERVGVGRSYVKLAGKLDFNSWCEGIRNGRCYVSDGMSHLMDFQAVENNPANRAVKAVDVGVNGSEMDVRGPTKVTLRAKVAALLGDQIDENSKRRFPWHIERARIGTGKEVWVDAIVNGHRVDSKLILCDGSVRDVSFDVKIERSSWVALRIFPSSHTNPIFIVLDNKPIRASRRSAEWCLKSVDQCWSQKRQFYKSTEMEDATQAYEHARQSYRRILSECDAD